MPSRFTTIQSYINFALGIGKFLNTPTTLAEAESIVRQQIENREANFISTLKSNVFDYAPSPYLPLFQRAKMTHADVERMVGTQGLEATLEQLFAEGIYATFEEVKGREPIRRGDLVIPVKATDFDSPNLNTMMMSQSGGSTGAPTRTKMDFEHLALQAKLFMLCFAMYDLLDVPVAIWRGLLPETNGVRNIMRFAQIGVRDVKWFSPVKRGEANLSKYYVVLTYIMILLGRFNRFPFPSPEFVPLDKPAPIVDWARQALDQHGRGLIRTSVSKSVRICMNATERNIDLTGLVFHGGGEPPTQAKINAIEATGATYLSHYSFNEGGAIGMMCGHAQSPDDVHFMANKFAMIQRPVTVFDQTVDAICLTSLMPFSPKVLLNVQTDDFATIEQRDCGCLLHQMGLTEHISNIRSYRKLTAEGMTLVGSDMIHIIEEVLPQTFGGGPLDYQLVEEEQPNGMTRLVLYIAPHIDIHDETSVATTFLNMMRDSMPSARLAEAEYRYGNVVTIRRETPIRTSRNKHFPIRTLHRQEK